MPLNFTNQMDSPGCSDEALRDLRSARTNGMC
jgi:hypothetical protein